VVPAHIVLGEQGFETGPLPFEVVENFVAKRNRILADLSGDVVQRRPFGAKQVNWFTLGQYAALELLMISDAAAGLFTFGVSFMY
jgi:hypothetical protein